MNCPSCGSQISGGATFCGLCGTRFEAAAQAAHSINLDTDGQGAGRGYT